uniref:Uncharacterized protein n=1 Tax=Branchiostoma floridae TaxID=7739 RepID=C3ZA04_BRAFL|eukprot:XP_002594581.1 hypothetical protein BRAFLDRAFT_77552 [Branchiostoma floridae]
MEFSWNTGMSTVVRSRTAQNDNPNDVIGKVICKSVMTALNMCGINLERRSGCQQPQLPGTVLQIQITSEFHRFTNTCPAMKPQLLLNVRAAPLLLETLHPMDLLVAQTCSSRGRMNLDGLSLGVDTLLSDVPTSLAQNQTPYEQIRENRNYEKGEQRRSVRPACPANFE